VALWREQLSSVLWSVATPVLNTRALPAVVFSSITAQFASKNALVAESNALRAALASSSILLLDRNLLYFENRDLKLRLGREANSPSILAAVLLAPGARITWRNSAPSPRWKEIAGRIGFVASLDVEEYRLADVEGRIGPRKFVPTFADEGEEEEIAA